MSWLPASVAQSLRLPSGGFAHERERARLELIRAAVLESLEGTDGGPAGALARRARGAGDVQRLWHLRVDLMTVLASTYGEVAAHRKVRDITELFHAFPTR